MKLTESLLGLFAVLASVSYSNAGYSSGCLTHCPYGQVLDVSRCICVPDRVLVDPIYHCPQLKCVTGPFPCKEYKIDANGCQTCQCLDRCFRSKCPRTCRGGTENYIDEKGCNACRCKQYPVCNDHFRCSLYCHDGYVTDINGCNTCQCKQAPCGAGCNIHCSYGRVLNYNGCELCECKPKPLCGPVCASTCHHGRVLDTYGCPTCQCNSG